MAADGASAPFYLLNGGVEDLGLIADQHDITRLVGDPASPGVSLRRLSGSDVQTFVGREQELAQAKVRLFCATRRNILLTGPSGVGKTSFVRKLAAVLASSGSRRVARLVILEANVGQLVAGTRYRGDFENRVSGLIRAVSAFENLVLFFDEAHTMAATGSESGIPITDLLKPHLLNGDLRVILATTDTEASLLEADAAFARRFERVQLKPLGYEERHRALQAHFKYLREYHGSESVGQFEFPADAATDLSKDLHSIIDQVDFALARQILSQAENA